MDDATSCTDRAGAMGTLAELVGTLDSDTPVTQDLPAGGVAVGNPARVFRHL